MKKCGPGLRAACRAEFLYKRVSNFWIPDAGNDVDHHPGHPTHVISAENIPLWEVTGGGKQNNPTNSLYISKESWFPDVAQITILLPY
jgi:hypothetical protein